MDEEEIIKEVQRCLSMLIEDEELKSLLVAWVKSGKSPEEVANHVRGLVIRHIITN